MAGKILVLFGAGKYGKEAIRYLDIGRYEKAYFADNDKNKTGTVLEGLPVIGFGELSGLIGGGGRD